MNRNGLLIWVETVVMKVKTGTWGVCEHGQGNHFDLPEVVHWLSLDPAKSFNFTYWSRYIVDCFGYGIHERNPAC